MVFTPTWVTAAGHLAMRPETAAAVEAQQFDGRFEWHVGLHNPIPAQSHQNVLAQFQCGRELFLASDCDALLTLEHDVVLPDENAVQRLYDTPADVVYGVYLLRHGNKVVNAFEYVGDRNLGESLTLHPRKLADARKRGVVRVSGAGNGCLLIRRHVVEQFEFHKGDGQQWCPDIPFALDCLRGNITSLARFDVACDHFDGERRLRPFGDATMDKVKVVARARVWTVDNGRSLALEPGQEYLLSKGLAADLERAAYVARVEATTDQEPETAALAPGERAVKARPARKRKGSL
jgi:hypothetical protein